jgi:hypothetical protein
MLFCDRRLLWLSRDYTFLQLFSIFQQQNRDEEAEAVRGPTGLEAKAAPIHRSGVGGNGDTSGS